MDSRLNIPHSAKVECGFRTTPEKCLCDSGFIGLSIGPHNTIQYKYNTVLRRLLCISLPNGQIVVSRGIPTFDEENRTKHKSHAIISFFYLHPFTCIPLVVSGGIHLCIYPSHLRHIYIYIHV